MELQFTGLVPEEGSPVHEAVSAARYYTVRDNAEPWLYAYGPVARMNPFQALCYSAFGEHGLAVTPVTDPWSFRALMSLQGQTRGVVYHLHWLAFITQGAATAAEARANIDRFLAEIDRFRQAGGKLVWTVHNVINHDAAFLDEELRLQQAIADAADLIHVMSEDTPELVQDFLRLPRERVICVPHPSYLGSYEDYLPRDHARIMLGLEPDEIVYAVVGAIKAYKGIERLVEAFNLALERSDRPRRLIIAGGADSDRSTRELIRQLRMHPYVLVQDRRVPGDHVQRLLRAADVMVLPHERALNSGGALLGPSFGLPLVAGRVGVLPGLLSEEFTEFANGTSAGEWADALERADRLTAPAARDAAAAFAERHHTRVISPQLAAAVRDGLNLEEERPDASS
ncbi:glycosyltransferase [Citricoccus sp. GCM10030269]|uniref:glycosyltransferase n=1 Tax=Citricoccus sp. GCM10030269 TaxID=3273388 RepID=UPI0036105E27